MPDINQIVEKILQDSNYQKLKEIVENNPYHNKQTVFDHAQLAFQKAKELLNGELITNEEAKEKYLAFLEEEIAGVKRKEILPLIALLHDIGKAGKFQEGERVQTILTYRNDGISETKGHEYVGSVLVEQILVDVNLPIEVKNYIEKAIRLHMTFITELYFNPKVDWPIEQLLDDVKSMAEDIYVEMLFNAYCDGYVDEIFQTGIVMITKLFNEPRLYIPRSYSF
jgi:hypothetical protein